MDLDRWSSDLVSDLVKELERVTPEMGRLWRSMDAGRAEWLMTRWREVVVTHVRAAVWKQKVGG